MKFLLKKIIFILLLNSMVSCDEEVTSRNYPRIKTLPVTEIKASGAKFNAEVIFRGDFEILNYGFVWAENENPTLINNDKFVFSENLQSSNFSTTITSTLEKEVEYFVRAFAQTSDFIVYGENVEFRSFGSDGPKIETIEPKIGTIGDTIKIIGENFSFLNSKNVVQFNDSEAERVSSTDSIVTVIVPLILGSNSKVSISIAGNISNYEGQFDITKPTLSDFQPKVLAIDDTLTIYGTNFSLTNDGNIVEINEKVSKVVFAAKNVLKAIIPSGLATENQITLSIAGQEASFQERLTFLEPKLISVEPNLVSFGEIITIHGENLSFINENNTIEIGSTSAVVVSSSKDQVEFLTPNEISQSSGNILNYCVAGRCMQFESIALKPPIIHSVSPPKIETFYNGEITIFGENFNPIALKNKVMLEDKYGNIISTSNEKIVVNFGRLMSDPKLSVNLNATVSVEVLDQVGKLENAIAFDYEGRWTRLNDFPGADRRYGVSFTLEDIAYVGLGLSNNFDLLDDFWKYDEKNDSWTQISSFPGGPRYGAVVVAIDTKAYIIGGVNEEDVNLNEIWEFNSSGETWLRKDDFPGDARRSPIGFSIKNRGFFGGGRAIRNFDYFDFLDFWCYNAEFDTWNRLKDLPSDIGTISSFRQPFADDNEAFYITFHSSRKYNPTIDIWEEFRALNSQVGPGFVLNGKPYAGTGPSNFYRYVEERDSWESESIEGGFNGGRPISFKIGDIGYLIFTSTDKGGELWKFDPSKP